MKSIISRALAIALVALVAACGGDDTDPPATTEAASGGEAIAITITDFAFAGPDTVAVGDTVTVTNEDSMAHTWTAVGNEFDSGSLGEGESFDFTFDEAGEFDYFCTIHPTMTGTVTVEG